jgi:hypothetical protein
LAARRDNHANRDCYLATRSHRNSIADLSLSILTKLLTILKRVNPSPERMSTNVNQGESHESKNSLSCATRCRRVQLFRRRKVANSKQLPHSAISLRM